VYPNDEKQWDPIEYQLLAIGNDECVHFERSGAGAVAGWAEVGRFLGRKRRKWRRGQLLTRCLSF